MSPGRISKPMVSHIMSIFYCCICDCPDHCCSFNAISPVLSLDCTDRKLFAWVQTSPRFPLLHTKEIGDVCMQARKL